MEVERERYRGRQRRGNEEATERKKGRGWRRHKEEKRIKKG